MFALTFLGPSASVPSAGRNPPGLLIEAGSQRILVDCGEGTQRQLLRGGVGFRRLDRLLLTHGHFDHVLGIPGLFSTLRLRRSADLTTIHGSPGALDSGEGGVTSREPMPDRSKGAAQSCGTDQRGKQHHCLSFHTGSRASTRATCIGRHSPVPRGVRTARRLSALARPFLLVMPAAAARQ
jgi:ribonuclease BN (tRNA processing enzyme)